MTSFALLAVGVAGLAVAVVAVRAWLGLARLERALRSLEAHAEATAREWQEAARGVRRVAGKLEGGVESLANTLERVDRMTAAVEPQSLARTVVAPAAERLGAWLAGLRKGLAGLRGER